MKNFIIKGIKLLKKLPLEDLAFLCLNAANLIEKNPVLLENKDILFV